MPTGTADEESCITPGGQRREHENPTTNPNCHAHSHDRKSRPIIRKQGLGGGATGTVAKRALAISWPPDETVASGERRGRPNTRSTREGDRNEITVFRRCRPYRPMFSGDSAIPESRATGATTSPIARDCDRPIDGGRGCPTVQNVKRGQRNEVRGSGEECNRETPRQRLPESNAIRRESEGRGGGW